MNGRYEEWFQRRRTTTNLDLSTIDALAERHQGRKKTNLLLSSLSPGAFQTLMSMGLTQAEMEDYNTVLNKIKEQCNAGLNSYVWQHSFRLHTSVSTIGCDLHDLALKCKFNDQTSTREEAALRQQLILRVYDDEVRMEIFRQRTRRTKLIGRTRYWQLTGRGQKLTWLRLLWPPRHAMPSPSVLLTHDRALP